MIKQQTYARTFNIKVYPTTTTPSQLVKLQSIISGVIDTEGQLYVCIDNVSKSGISLHTVEFDDNAGYWKYDLWYAPVIFMSNRQKQCSDRKDLVSMASDYFIMVPHYSNDENEDETIKGRTVFCRSWRVRYKEGKLRLPTPSKDTLLYK